MTIITKGMGVILKKATTKSSIEHSKLAEKGYKKIKVPRLTPTKKGSTTQVRMVGPFKGFSTKPKMPVRKGQGVLFTEKYERMPGDPNVLPGQLKFKFKNKKQKDPAKTLKTLTKKAEIK